ncbi:hypothetical protein [Leucobacter japonicus]|uniref:hypothetical protein n=1 Tax=Leucobacter japonicus TaxID=1461259 RepID=UPI000A7FE319|nr:hypothetical protein [Leucobacter japonicus]
MTIERLFDYRETVGHYFGQKALYVDTVRYESHHGEESGHVRFLLYGSFVFGFGFPGAQFSSLSCFFQVSDSVSTTEFCGKDHTFIENNLEALEEAFSDVDRFCRLRLPEKFLLDLESRSNNI